MPKSAPSYILIFYTLILTLILLCLIRLHPMMFRLFLRFPNDFFSGLPATNTYIGKNSILSAFVITTLAKSRSGSGALN